MRDERPYVLPALPQGRDFSSDIGHWDVPDMTEDTEEAYGLVEHGLIDEGNFRDSVFANPARL